LEERSQLVGPDRAAGGAHPRGEQLQEALQADVVEHGRRLDDLGRGLVVARIEDPCQVVREVVRQLARGHPVTIKGCRDSEIRSRFAASTAGARERVTRLGAHRRCVTTQRRAP